MATISKAEVVSIREFGIDIREYVLKLETPAYFDAGSFLQLTLEKKIGNRWPESRNFSIASSYRSDGFLKLIIRKVGQYTGRIFNELQVGAKCYVKLSFGDFLLPFKNRKSKIICIAGGTGIAPMLSFIDELNALGEISRVKLLYSVKNRQEFIGNDTISTLDQENVYIHFTREEVKGYNFGRLTFDNIKYLSDDLENDNFYVCGGEEFTRCFKSELQVAGAENVFTDEW